MKKLLPALMLTVTTSVFGQVKTNYDKFKDQTTVLTDIGISKIGVRVLSTVDMRVMFTYPGQSSGEVPQSYYVFFTTRITGNRGWMWLNGDRMLRFIYDDGHAEFGPGSRSSNYNNGTFESLGFVIDRNTLESLAKSEKVEMQVGSFEGYMGDKDRRKLQEILDYK